MPLDNMQYEIDGLVFGRGTEYLVVRVEFGQPTVVINDAPLPREDGVRFGRDTLHGRTVLFDMVMNKKNATEAENLEALDLITSAWSADEARILPDELVVLRMNRFGRSTRIYGRPRNFAPIMGTVSRGYVPITADFQCVDHLFYADEEGTNTLSIVPAPVGGFIFPITFPVSSSGIGEKEGEITIGGNRPTWVTVTINGPITNPQVDVLDSWKATLLMTIADGQSVTIDPRPWSRGILLDGVANVAGKLTADSPWMSQMKVDPGEHQIVLRGTDPTGTASMIVTWRDAYRSV